MITIKIADIPIALDNRFELIETVAADYICDDAPLFTVSVTDSEIAKQRERQAEYNFSDAYLESISLYRHIADRLPDYDGFVFHGCVIEHNGGAYVFTAQSGVGKTTHARNWLSEFGDKVHILNGDKPIIRIIDGVPYACGTPWKGKEGYGVNEMCPLRAIAFIERGERNTAERTTVADALIRLMKQVYLPVGNPLALAKTMKIADKVLKEIPLVTLKCNMDPESAHVAFDALINNIYI